jgi:ferric-dicitrate binding protein FerR (iron transport regulator)
MTIEIPDDIRRMLASAPESPPSPALWARVVAGRRRQIRRRRIAAGVAGAAVMMAFALLLPWAGPASDPAEDQMASVVTMPGNPDVAADVRAIDHALQVAYRRGASDDELAPLWNTRQQILARVPPIKTKS